ncbi:MAG: hypothetical protein FJ135_12215 [Deltaproteobacteria bacterium]|nr:hypothetical protein [Deltaproteobacteria bacterium]
MDFRSEPKRGRGRPKKIAQAPAPEAFTSKEKASTGEGNKSALVPEIIESTVLKDIININLKSDFSEKEMKFLEYYLPGEMKQEDAAKLAGYDSTCERYLRKIAQKVVQKYESRMEDHRKIMRAMGYGEIKVIQLLIEAATTFNSETVKLNARIALSKCLGLQKSEVLEAVQGVQIIIKQGDVQGDQTIQSTSAKPAQPTALPVPVPGVPKVRMIK